MVRDRAKTSTYDSGPRLASTTLVARIPGLLRILYPLLRRSRPSPRKTSAASDCTKVPAWAEVQARPALSRLQPPQTDDLTRFQPVTGDDSQYGCTLVFVVQPAYADAEDVGLSVQATGISYIASGELEASIRQRMEARGIRLAPGFRVLEVGREPATLAGSASLLAGALLVLAIVLSNLKRRRQGTIVESAFREAPHRERCNSPQRRSKLARRTVVEPPSPVEEPAPETHGEEEELEEPETSNEQIIDLPSIAKSPVLAQAAWFNPRVQSTSGHESYEAALDFVFAEGEDAPVESESSTPRGAEAPVDPTDPFRPDGETSPLLNDDRKRARRAIRFQEFGEILAFSADAGEPPTESSAPRRPRLLESFSRTACPDDDTLAILESCELVEADTDQLPDAEVPHIAENMPGMVRLIRECPRQDTSAESESTNEVSNQTSR